MATRKNNSREEKREAQTLAHNRKAGAAARGKTLRHKRSRRNGKVGLTNMVRSYVPHLFKQ